MTWLGYIWNGLLSIMKGGAKTMKSDATTAPITTATITPYSQKDPRWARVKLGNSEYTLGSSGCLITCLGMMVNRLPIEINRVLSLGKAFAQGGLLRHLVASEILGLKWLGVSYNKLLDPKFVTVMETDYYAPKFPQHFVLWLGDGSIIDPLDGRKKVNKYPIVGWRLYKNA
jgi:hypothetical protein